MNVAHSLPIIVSLAAAASSFGQCDPLQPLHGPQGQDGEVEVEARAQACSQSQCQLCDVHVFSSRFAVRGQGRAELRAKTPRCKERKAKRRKKFFLL